VTGSVVRVKGLQRFRNRKTGRVYCYHRASGRRLEAEFGTPEFFAELASIEAAHKQQEKRHTAPRTLGDMIQAYMQSPRFRDLQPRTRKDYLGFLDDLKEIYAMPLAAVDKPFLARLRDDQAECRSWHYANYLLAVLSAVFKLAEEHGVMQTNPALRLAKLKRPKDRAQANRPWSPSEWAAIRDAAPPHMRLPLAIGALTGLRISDIVALPKTACRDGWLQHETAKRRVEICHPIDDELRAEILRAPAHDAITLCANSRGLPWTEDGLRCVFAKLRDELEEQGQVAPGLTIHGLRHMIASRLAEHDVSEHGIATWLGQKTSAMARHYSARANKKKRMEATVLKLRVKPGR
jgi:integrase